MGDIITVLLVVLAIISLMPGNKKKKEEQQRRQAEKNKNRRSQPQREPQPESIDYTAAEESPEFNYEPAADSETGHKYKAKTGGLQQQKKKADSAPGRTSVKPAAGVQQQAAPAFTGPVTERPQVNALTVMAKEVGTKDPLAYAMLMSEIFQPPLSKRERKKP